MEWKYWITSLEITTRTELPRIISCTKRAHVSYWLQLLMLLSKVVIKMQSSSSNVSFDSTDRQTWPSFSCSILRYWNLSYIFYTCCNVQMFSVSLLFYLLPPDISRSSCAWSSLSYCPFILLFASVILILWIEGTTATATATVCMHVLATKLT
jgi:hypothetical protein